MAFNFIFFSFAFPTVFARETEMSYGFCSRSIATTKVHKFSFIALTTTFWLLVAKSANDIGVGISTLTNMQVYSDLN